MEFSGIDPDSQKPKLVDTNGKFSQAVSVCMIIWPSVLIIVGPSGMVVGTAGLR